MNNLFLRIMAFSLLRVVLSAQTEGATASVIKNFNPAGAELPEMVTDRPDFTESTDVVGKDIVQIENGFTMERNLGGNNIAGPELLVRVGLTKRVEFRIGGDGFLSQRMPGAARIIGYSDMEIAAKITIFGEGKHRPALSLIPLLSAPLGCASFTSGAWDPTLKVALGKDFPKGFSLGGNVNLSSLTTPDGRFFQTALSASLGHSLGRGFGAYGEVFGFTPWDRGSTAAWIANTGVTRSLGRNAQVDIRFGKRLNSAGPNWFWGIGLAVRQPAGALFRAVRSLAQSRP